MNKRWLAVSSILALMAFVIAVFFYFFRSQTPGLNMDKVFASLKCPATTRTYLDATSYQGTLIDTHIHIPPIPDGPIINIFPSRNGRPSLGTNMTIPEYVCMMDAEGTKAIFAFFPVWDPIRQESLIIVKEALARFPNRFIPFIMPPDHDDREDGFPTVTAKALEAMLSTSPQLFTGYGEIGLYARGDHGGPKGALALPPNAPRLQEIYPVVAKNNLLVYFHLGEGQQQSFEQVLEANPNINFIWHGDQLIPQVNGRQELSAIEEILDNHPNAYYGVDQLYGNTWLLRPGVKKEKFLTHLKNYEELLIKDLATWEGFIKRHPDQVLWGSDRGWSAPWSIDPDVAVALNNYSRAFIGRLDPSVQERFAHKNAEGLLSKQ